MTPVEIWLPTNEQRLHGMISPHEAFFRLRDGNRRFVTTLRSPDTHLTLPGRVELASTQEPFAIILGCSDSRVPVELIFDQCIGDLFVIRVAGNIASPSQIGSIEYAARQFGIKLVVVMGHTNCGAVQATLEALRDPASLMSESLKVITDYISPAFGASPGDIFGKDTSELTRLAVRSNIRASVQRIQKNSSIVSGLMKSDGLRVIAAEYAVETGSVDFFEGV